MVKLGYPEILFRRLPGAVRAVAAVLGFASLMMSSCARSEQSVASLQLAVDGREFLGYTPEQFLAVPGLRELLPHSSKLGTREAQLKRIHQELEIRRQEYRALAHIAFDICESSLTSVALADAVVFLPTSEQESDLERNLASLAAELARVRADFLQFIRRTLLTTTR
jgi:hypothetical protein